MKPVNYYNEAKQYLDLRESSQQTTKGVQYARSFKAYKGGIQGQVCLLVIKKY